MTAREKGRKVDTFLEDYGVKPVPLEKTRTWFQMGIVFWGIYICVPTFMLGGHIARNARFITAVLAAITGSFILTVISLATGVAGAHTKMSTAMTSKLAFGKNCSHLMAALLCIVSFGMFGIQLEVFGRAARGAVETISRGSLKIPLWVPIISGGALMMSTPLIGFKAIQKLKLLAVPPLLVLMAITLVKVYSGTPLTAAFLREPSSPIPFGRLVTAVAGAGTFAIGAVIQPDITRYAHGRGHAAGSVVFGMMAGFPLILVMASLLWAGTGNSDFADIMRRFMTSGWGAIALFFIIMATWTTNDSNLYSSALSLNAIFTNVKKWQLTLIAGCVSIGLALGGILGQFVKLIELTGVALPPIGAVISVELFLFRGMEYKHDFLEKMKGLRALPYISWAAATAFGLLSNFKGFTLTRAPALDAIIAAFALHFILMLASGRRISILKTARKGIIAQVQE